MRRACDYVAELLAQMTIDRTKAFNHRPEFINLILSNINKVKSKTKSTDRLVLKYTKNTIETFYVFATGHKSFIYIPDTIEFVIERQPLTGKTRVTWKRSDMKITNVEFFDAD